MQARFSFKINIPLALYPHKTKLHYILTIIKKINKCTSNMKQSQLRINNFTNFRQLNCANCTYSKWMKWIWGCQKMACKEYMHDSNEVRWRFLLPRKIFHFAILNIILHQIYFMYAYKCHPSSCLHRLRSPCKTMWMPYHSASLRRNSNISLQTSACVQIKIL